MDAAPDVDAGADGGPVDAPPPDAGPPERWFDDIAATSGIALDRVPADGYASLPDRMSGGVCPIDVDGRAPIDLFFAMRGGQSKLYVGTAPLTWEDQTVARGITLAHDSIGCLAVDVDGDRDDDLLVTGLGSIVLWENTGGTFADGSSRFRFTLHTRDLYMSAGAGDLDADGDLDLVVGGFMRFDPSEFTEGAMCGYIPCTADISAYDYIGSLTLIRNADGSYSERSAMLAPQMLEPEPTLMMTIEDIVEGDRPEIFVGNDIGYRFMDRVLEWNGVQFTDVALDFGLSTNRHGYGVDTMGWSSADINDDGIIDHVASSFEGDATAVYLCARDFCEDRALLVGTVALERTFRWGLGLGDFDLDGHVDLIEATGHYHSDAEVSAIGFRSFREQRPNLMVGRGDGTLRVVAPPSGDGLDAFGAMRGLAQVDLDDDGRLDVVMAPAVGRPRVLLNVHTPRGHWLRVVLRGRSPNTPGANARVVVSGGGRAWVRERLVGEGFLGNFDPRMHFGLDTAGPVEVQVEWASGAVSRVLDVPVDSEVVVDE